ncbi:hypothetical protein RJP21_04615 [Paenibacillus sp. VCA1]|uniref:hypothetical protein n=1 Tax=Paenibacillus sp. VCA1 TaxID=3039148 RepID=UPI002871F174|nr:hypothetical protein [Paenibacillus sp. VCA1]MDR9852883.1 hypothetical protein [Paenibacillus sp. VCA1]
MKKFIAGVLVGALVFGAVPVLADSVKNLVGSKVAGVYVIEEKGGTKIADAAIINGSAYVPVRPISEATGTKLTVEGKKIILEKPTSTSNVPLEGDALSDGDLTIANQITSLKNSIRTYESNIQVGNLDIANLKKEIEEENARNEKMPGRLEALQHNLAERQSYVADQQGKIDAANAEIAKLQTKLNGNK